MRKTAQSWTQEGLDTSRDSRCSEAVVGVMGAEAKGMDPSLGCCGHVWGYSLTSLKIAGQDLSCFKAVFV